VDSESRQHDPTAPDNISWLQTVLTRARILDRYASSHHDEPLTAAHVGVICPYVGQVRSIKRHMQEVERMLKTDAHRVGFGAHAIVHQRVTRLLNSLEYSLKKIEVRSVDGFQGKEKDVRLRSLNLGCRPGICSLFLYSRHFPLDHRVQLRPLQRQKRYRLPQRYSQTQRTFTPATLSRPRTIHTDIPTSTPQVAFTRARRGLVVVGNARCLRTNPAWASFLDLVAERGTVMPAAALAPWLATGAALPDWMFSEPHPVSPA
jgi:hypothetical protein